MPKNHILSIKRILIPLIILSLILSCQELSSQPISRARPQAEESDGSPSGYYWKWIFPNNSMVDNLDGTIDFDFYGSVSADLLPDTTCTYDLGSSSLLWKDGYFNGRGYFGSTYTATLGGYGFSSGYFVGNNTLAIIGTTDEAGYFENAGATNTVALGNVAYSVEAVGDVDITGTLTADQGFFGTVGIGTTKPLTALDVLGDITLSDDIYADTPLKLYVNNQLAHTWEVSGDNFIFIDENNFTFEDGNNLIFN